MTNGVKSCRRVKNTKTKYFLRAYSIYEMIKNVEESCFDGVIFTLGRLVRIKKIVRKATIESSLEYSAVRSSNSVWCRMAGAQAFYTI